MVATVLTVLGLVVGVLALVVGWNLATLAMMRAGLLSRSDALEGGLLMLVGLAGAVVLWTGLDGSFGVRLPSLPLEFKVGALLLYLSGCLSYLEVKSLVARSCSLRVLIDLLDGGGQASVDKLKSGYGGGLGVEGLLVKRLRTMAALGLLQIEAGMVGPLRPSGRVLAQVGHGLRRLLRLESVG